MIESFRIFGLLLYKNWLVRKKQKGETFFKQVLFPLGMVFFIWAISALSRYDPEDINYDSHYEMQSFEDLTAAYHDYSRKGFVVTPANDFIRRLMNVVQRCMFVPDGPSYYSRFMKNEKEIIEHHYKYPGKFTMAIIFVDLSRCASKPSGTYSGGNKRRLNIAIALIGNPNVILMDEPTTGVDPLARRALWNVIKSCQMAGQTFVLASHSMEECEALCNRLAILKAGKLVCIGASEELKQRFGAGYDIQIKLNPEKASDQIDAIKTDMEKALRCDIVDENMGYLMYHVEAAGTTWREMYDAMNGMKSKYNSIEDFSILSTSLEQLFLMFAKSGSSSSAVQYDGPDHPS